LTLSCNQLPGHHGGGKNKDAAGAHYHTPQDNVCVSVYVGVFSREQWLYVRLLHPETGHDTNANTRNKFFFLIAIDLIG
jgi:hypothetical protein